MKRVIAAIGTAASIALCAAAAPAQQAGAPHLSLSPAVITTHGKFGQSMTQTIALNNGTSQGLSFEMTAEDVVIKNGKRVYVRAGETPHSIAASAIFSQRTGSVAAGSDQAVQVRLTIPDETSIRGVVIYFRATNVVAQHGLVSLNASLGALITFVLTDDIAVTADAPSIHPATASANLKVVEALANTGSEPVVPQGVAAFVDASGALAAKIPFEDRRLLPGEHGSYTAEYAGRLKPGRYRVICTFGFEGKTVTSTGEFTAP